MGHQLLRENSISTRPRQPRIAVVIPTRDRPAPLLVCLRALATEPDPGVEMIVVNDGGDPDRLPDFSELDGRLDLEVIHAPHGGPAAARNRGLEQVRAPVVLFTDDDCLPQAGWAAQLAAAVSQNPPTAVGGRTLNADPENIYAQASQLVLDLCERDQALKCYAPVFFPTNNIAFPTDALREIGGFDERYQVSEDREVCRRWLTAGYRLVKAPGAVLSHAPELGLAGFCRKFVKYGEGAARFHGDAVAGCGISYSFHLRIPRLVVAEFAERGEPRRLRLAALLCLWELANAVGYLRGRLHLRGVRT